MIDFDFVVQERWVLSEEGAEVAAKGSHEARVFKAVPEGPEGIPIPDLAVCCLAWPCDFNTADSLLRNSLESRPSLARVRPSRPNGLPRLHRARSFALYGFLVRTMVGRQIHFFKRLGAGNC